MKMLKKCQLCFELIENLQKIFGMIQKKNKILKQFLTFQEIKSNEEACEEILAALCLQSSRLFHQLNCFLDLFQKIKPSMKTFILDGKDVKK